MKLRILTLTAAASLALAGATATPVRADQNFNNFLIAAGAIMIIAGATSNARGGDRGRTGPSRTVIVERHHVVPGPALPPPMVRHPRPCRPAPHMGPGVCLP